MAATVYAPGGFAFAFITLGLIWPRAAMCMTFTGCPTPYETYLATDYKICNCNAPNPEDYAFITSFFEYWETTGTTYTYQGNQCCQVQGNGVKQFKIPRDVVPEGECKTGNIKLNVTGNPFPNPNPTCPSGVTGTFNYAEFLVTSPDEEACGS